MPAGRFIVEGMALAPGAEIELPPEIAHQARDVLRLAAGDSLRLLDGAGGEYPAEVLVCDRRHVTVRLGERIEAIRAEVGVRVVLHQGVLKGARFELVLQKCTELGVVAFAPVLTQRALGAVDETSDVKRKRWTRIVAEAVEQCGGARLPELLPPRSLGQSLVSIPASAVALIPWEGKRANPLRGALRAALGRGGEVAEVGKATASSASPPEVHLFIGPEGGFSYEEVELAQRLAGAVPVTLGPRVLRAETAAIVAVALTLDALGALDAPPPAVAG